MQAGAVCVFKSNYFHWLIERAVSTNPAGLQKFLKKKQAQLHWKTFEETAYTSLLSFVINGRKTIAVHKQFMGKLKAAIEESKAARLPGFCSAGCFGRPGQQ